MKFKAAVVIGRFQPFHMGHRDLAETALMSAERVVIVIGSANSARSLRNPFAADERIQMIKPEIRDPERVVFLKVRDYFYNDSGWTNEVREKLREAVGSGPIALVGHEKDVTSSYLKWFPEWERLEVPCAIPCHATDLRESYLRDEKSIAPSRELSPSMKSWLSDFAKSKEYRELHAEQRSSDDYKKSWASAPFPPIFVTTDALVTCAGHVLLIQRGHAPGKGNWAMPGGFLDAHERIETCALRELEEETKLDVLQEELKAALVDVRVFDHPLRSTRGRTITHAHHFALKRTSLPAFQASDDAAAAKWVPILDIGKMESQFHEDHFHIINALL